MIARLLWAICFGILIVVTAWRVDSSSALSLARPCQSNRGDIFRQFTFDGKTIADLDELLLQTPKLVAALESRAIPCDLIADLEVAHADYEQLLEILNGSGKWPSARLERIPVVEAHAMTVREPLSAVPYCECTTRRLIFRLGTE